MNIRAATLADVPALATIEQQCNPSPWTNSQLNDAILQPTPIWIIEQKNIIAMLVWQMIADEAEIHLLNTHPDYRRQGYAQQLLHYLWHQTQQHKLTRILLEVRSSNLAAQQLYKHNGFIICGQRKNYYRNGEDALLMEKKC